MEQWINVVEPTPEQTAELIAAIEGAVGSRLHDVVRDHFTERRTDPAHAFPRLEDHFDEYLFGQFHLPTDANDHLSEYMELTFVATFGGVWSVLRVPTRTDLTQRFIERLARTIDALANGSTVGDVVGRLMTIVVSELERFLEETGSRIDALTENVEALDKAKNLSRVLKEKLPEFQKELVDIRREVASLGTVVDQMESIVDSVVRDEVDLHTEEGPEGRRELFGRSTEIHLLDTSFRARRVKAIQDEQLEQIVHLGDRMSVLVEHDELTSGRFMGAIASIMLVPTFLVGLYGMNFDKMPELHWHMGYGSVVIVIVIVTIFQIWLFRRKRWI